jgi:hypothetical protein
MVFNATFNNISAISWWSVLLLEEPEDPEKTTDMSQVTDKLSTNNADIHDDINEILLKVMLNTNNLTQYS